METYDLQVARAALALYALLLATAAVTDIRGFKIPNWVSAGLLLLFVPVAVLLRKPSSPKANWNLRHYPNWK